MSRVRSRDVWLPLLGLAAIVLAVYSPAISGERIWDDVILLGENQCVLGETPWTDAFTTPFWPFDDYYRPLTALTLRALNALGEEHRTILVMRGVQGFDYATIAQILGLNPGTVRSRLHRARIQLRQHLARMQYCYA